jgi:hypothetical protein
MEYVSRCLATAIAMNWLLSSPAQADDMTDTARAQIGAFVEAVISGPDKVDGKRKVSAHTNFARTE